MNLRELTERCAGAEKKQQEAYLENVLLKVMIDKYGHGNKLPDENAVPAVLESMPIIEAEYVRDNPDVAAKLLDEFYRVVSKLLLEDTDFDILDLRCAAERKMAEEIAQREWIKSNAQTAKAL